MSGWVRGIVAGVGAIAATAGLVLLSRVPWTAHPGEHAQLRLAWRFRSERVEACRRLTADELAKLPAHMRREEVCEGGARPYRLAVWVDGRQVADDTIRAAGAHADRPLYVLREFELAPGRHDVRISFGPLAFASHLVLAPRQVALVTYDEERGALVRARAAVSAPR